jgi:hypothetical protein
VRVGAQVCVWCVVGMARALLRSFLLFSFYVFRRGPSATALVECPPPLISISLIHVSTYSPSLQLQCNVTPRGLKCVGPLYATL